MIWYQQVKREEAQKLSGGTTEVLLAGKIRLIFSVFKIHENPWLNVFFPHTRLHTVTKISLLNSTSRFYDYVN